MSSTNFYETLPVIEEQSLLTDPRRHTEIPDSWCLLLVDIQGLDDLLSAGRYRDAHTLTAGAVVAASNAVPGQRFPYYLCAGGARIFVPKEYLWEVSRSLLGLKQLSARRFDIAISVGYISMKDIRDGGHNVWVARARASSQVVQACFFGTGIKHAEHLLAIRHSLVTVPSDAGQRLEVDLTGLECRWRPLRPRKEEAVCLVVQPCAQGSEDAARVLASVRATISKIYGESVDRHPIRREALTLSLDRRALTREALLRATGDGRIHFERRLLALRLLALLGTFFMRFGVKAGGVRWATYKDMVIENADVVRVVHGMRLVLSGSSAQRARLSSALTEMYERGELCFGMHASTTLTMSCMVFCYADEHYHALDGADGGFYRAERQLLEQVAKPRASVDK